MTRKRAAPSARSEPAVPALGDRHRQILAGLVEAYVDKAEPVSSLWLAERGGFGVSSATVRNILARLETLGYVHQPHTSAGRVPTDLGYRCVVDGLLAGRRPARPAREVEERLRRAGTVEDVLEDASRELTRVSHHLGFAWAMTESASFQHIDFVPLDSHRVLVVVIAAGGRISHKAIEVDEAIRPADLQQAANYLNTEFAGLSLDEVREAILARMRQERTLYDRLVARALALASSSFADLAAQDMLVVQGAASLLDAGVDAASLDTLRALFRMLEEKSRLVKLLTEYIEGPGLVVVIGTEHAVPDLQPFSLVASTYSRAGRRGTIGVIGPTRMRYSRAIAVVDSLSRAVSRVLDAG
jgi:heat-inducible transcriptional repressor